MQKLSRKIAPGGNRRIGLATAHKFIKGGACVFITGIELFVDGGMARV